MTTTTPGAENAGERRLPHLERLSPKVRAVQLQQVEGVEKCRGLVVLSTQDMERRHAAHDRPDYFDIELTNPTARQYVHAVRQLAKVAPNGVGGDGA